MPSDNSKPSTVQYDNHNIHSVLRPSSVDARRFKSGGHNRTAGTAPASTPIMWFVEVNARRYMMSSR